MLAGCVKLAREIRFLSEGKHVEQSVSTSQQAVRARKAGDLHDSPHAHARDLVPFPKNKYGPSLLGLQARVLTDASVGGWKGGHIQEYSK